MKRLFYRPSVDSKINRRPQKPSTSRLSVARLVTVHPSSFILPPSLAIPCHILYYLPHGAPTAPILAQRLGRPGAASPVRLCRARVCLALAAPASAGRREPHALRAAARRRRRAVRSLG